MRHLVLLPESHEENSCKNKIIFAFVADEYNKNVDKNVLSHTSICLITVEVLACKI